MQNMAMRRRLRWIIPATIVIVGIALACWPRHDEYDFLRDLGAEERFVKTTNFGGIVGSNQGLPTEREFSFPISQESTVHSALDHNWRRDTFSAAPCWITKSDKQAIVEISPAESGQSERLLVEIYDDRYWFEQQLDALKRLLHIP